MCRPSNSKIIWIIHIVKGKQNCRNYNIWQHNLHNRRWIKQLNNNNKARYNKQQKGNPKTMQKQNKESNRYIKRNNRNLRNPN
jgi:hypothetical protein